MRVIEKQMIQAIARRKSWRNGNTSVDVHSSWCEVRLHGNMIARIDNEGVKFSLAGWNTATTRSRVNAILQTFCNGHARVSQKAFAPILWIGGVPHEISASAREWYDVPAQ